MRNYDQNIRLKNIVLYILKDFKGGTDYIKLYKILYFASREQLAETGIPLIYDNFKAWHKGPVPSFTGSIVKRLEKKEPLTGLMSSFEGALKVNANKKVQALTEADNESIPEYTRHLIDKYIRKYNFYNSIQLSKDSHDEAWREAYEEGGGKTHGNAIINPVSMARVGGGDEDIQNLIKLLFSHDHEYITVYDNSDEWKNNEELAFEIHHIMKMTDSWDGDDAEAIPKTTALNCRKMILKKKASILNIESLYPTPSGTICLDWRKNGAKVSAEIGDSKFAFYYSSSDRKDIYDSPTLDFNDAGLDMLFQYLEKIEN